MKAKVTKDNVYIFANAVVFAMLDAAFIINVLNSTLQANESSLYVRYCSEKTSLRDEDESKAG